MRTLHYALTGLMLVAVVAISAGAVQPWMSTALAQHGNGGAAQHGQAADAEAHFAAVAEQLGLSAAQQAALATPFEQGMTAMQELHRVHEAIVAELTDEQAQKFAQMVHEMMGEMMEAVGGEGHGLHTPAQHH